MGAKSAVQNQNKIKNSVDKRIPSGYRKLQSESDMIGYKK